MPAGRLTVSVPEPAVQSPGFGLLSLLAELIASRKVQSVSSVVLSAVVVTLIVAAQAGKPADIVVTRASPAMKSTRHGLDPVPFQVCPSRIPNMAQPFFPVARPSQPAALLNRGDEGLVKLTILT